MLISGRGLGSGDSLLDGAVEGFDCVVDLFLEGCDRIPFDNLKQVWIASDHDERIGRRSCHRGVQGEEAAPEPSQFTNGAGDGNLAVYWGWGYGGTRGQHSGEVKVSGADGQRHQLCVFVQRRQLCVSPQKLRRQCTRRWRGDQSASWGRADMGSRSGSAGNSRR